MQDRFKFRAWNKLSNELKDIKSLNINHSFPACSNVIVETNSFDKIKTHNMPIECSVGLNNIILMQCTGLKDKTGKLIFEGDILQLDSFKEDNVVHICFWNKETAEYLYEPIIKGDKNAPLLGIEEFAQNTEYMFEDKNDIPEIIGNIYENPELLEENRC